MTALLDRLVQIFPDCSRTTLRQMLQAGRVRVNGEVEKDAKADIARHFTPDQEIVLYRSGIEFIEPSERVFSVINEFIEAITSGRRAE